MNILEGWFTQRPVITDGAWGTQLQARGLELGALPDSWNLSHPDVVEDVARAYVEAGSEVILTNTFRSNAIALGEAGLADRLGELNRAGVAISRRAAAGRARVFASLGPTGKMLTRGELTAEEVTAAFATQARELAAAGADALLIETMSDVEEARFAVRAAKQTGLPVVVSFAFDTGKDHGCTMTGTTPEQAAQAMAEAGADAVGANCGAGIENFASICLRLKAACALPVWIKPNAGLPVIRDGAATYATSAEQFASHLPELGEAGASFVGGCCGTDPRFIVALKQTRSSM